MLPEVDALPRAKRHFSVCDRNRKVHRRQGSADVGGHVIVAFSGMNEEPIAIRHQAGKEFLQIAPHIRVGIFLNEQRSRGVAKVQSEQASSERVIGNPLSDVISEIVQAASRGVDFELI